MGFAALKKHVPQLKTLKRATPTQRKHILVQANTELITCICECCLNILNGNVKITKVQQKKLSRHAKTLRTLANRGIPVNKIHKNIFRLSHILLKQVQIKNSGTSASHNPPIHIAVNILHNPPIQTTSIIRHNENQIAINILHNPPIN